ncbi:sperm-associated antigen 1 isoform X1 [Callorhinchus milii]|uniref:sperm-associated antigen 1 isoform X1 n=1 Tax=Callorhinchus milii TaxID=7868 RepID=UPI001C3FA34F|nr:sperm-associated antigen 1 isoform X1 [Callorhinchus milii]XP_007894952.2 sperm-associated antigen 1 isoform X1 [Callorhinchus milii]
MTTEQIPPRTSEPSYAWTQGTTKTYNLPIEHLDYDFIEKCKDENYLGKILTVLRSGEEGLYPDLTGFCEKKIEKLNPNSRVLRKSKPAATAASFTADEWQEITGDLKSWTDEMKQKENEQNIRNTTAVDFSSENNAPVRGANSSILSYQNSGDRKSTAKKCVKPKDYKEWDKFDVEEECAKIDRGKQAITSKTIFNDGISGIEKEIKTTGMSDKEKMIAADREKDKGNEAFRAGDYKEAFAYYTRSISVCPTVAAYNNRAQSEIELKEWYKALNDSEQVLKLDPGNLKALLRRATVYKHLGKCEDAAEDLKIVLQAEPLNPVAKKLLEEVEQKLKNSQPPSKTQKKGKRMTIKVVEDSIEEERENANQNEDSNTQFGGGTTNAKTVMGNILKKFSSKHEGQSNEKNTANGKNDSQNTATRGNAGNGSKDSLPAVSKNGPSKHNSETGSKNVKNDTNTAKRRNQDPPKTDDIQVSAVRSFSPTVREKSLQALPSAIAKLKSEGNELFKNGQFGAAELKYTEAITELTESATGYPAELSILYSNRAACYLKDGNSSECIQDCTRSLELQPYSIKPLLRRAMGYESLERYRQAYVDYKTALQIDSRIQIANDSVNRITRTLIEQDGTNWREKLPPIPTVPVSAQQYRWDEASASTARNKTLSTDQKQIKSDQDLGKSTEELFISLKTEGNSFVKKARYKEAVGKYSECLKLKPNECAIYTNRALCYLKLNQYKNAEDDCSCALKLEPSNVKAFYRRALAYKGLQNYTVSIDDLNKVLKLDSNVAEAQKELQEVSELLKKQRSASSHEKSRKKIQIDEVADGDEEETGPKQQDATKQVGSGDPTEDLPYIREAFENSHSPSEKGALLKPTNAYEFGQAFNVLRSKKDSTACAELLRNVEPKDLPLMITNKLESDAFTMIFQALEGHLLQEDPNRVYQHLIHLCKVERFKVVLMLLGKEEKEQVQQLFNSLLQMKSDLFAPEDIQNLAENYDIQS